MTQPKLIVEFLKLLDKKHQVLVRKMLDKGADPDTIIECHELAAQYYKMAYHLTEQQRNPEHYIDVLRSLQNDH
jgi:hypothetical protein